MEIRRKDSEKPCASAILQQLFKCNLDVHACRDRELPPRCCDIIRGHAKVLQERLPQTRLAEATVAKGNTSPIQAFFQYSSHPSFARRETAYGKERPRRAVPCRDCFRRRTAPGRRRGLCMALADWSAELRILLEMQNLHR
jgi:hypothetical protein